MIIMASVKMADAIYVPGVTRVEYILFISTELHRTQVPNGNLIGLSLSFANTRISKIALFNFIIV